MNPEVTSVTITSLYTTTDSPSGIPSLNLGNHCSDGNFYYSGLTKTGLPIGCSEISRDIEFCQNKGIKILLSIGGPDANALTLSSPYKGVEFAKWLVNTFGPKPFRYNGPRPFDRPGHTVVLDGFDLDLEFATSE
jgi:chitinase